MNYGNNVLRFRTDMTKDKFIEVITLSNLDKSVILMTNPETFEILDPSKNPDANHWEIKGYEVYKKDPEGVRAKLLEQWYNLRNVLEKCGAIVAVIQPEDDMPDQIYTADPSQSYRTLSFDPSYGFKVDDRVTIFSKFTKIRRNVEVVPNKSRIMDVIKIRDEDRRFVDAEYIIEGTGDNLYDIYRGVIWSGHGIRSTLEAHKELEEITGIEVIGLGLKKPFFHIDTCFTALPRGHIMAYEPAFAEGAFDKMLENAFDRFDLPRDELLIRTTEDDVECFAHNLVTIGDNLIIPTCSEVLQKRLENLGYIVHPVDLSMAMLSGGAAHCMTNKIDQAHIPDGILGLEQQMGIKVA